jgi:hypothetical protein
MKTREFHPPHIYEYNAVAPIYKFIKRLHGDSAIQLNKLDNTPGRQVWYQYWDRFPRNERDFWAYFSYIHLNPIKHGYVRVSDGILVVEGRQVKIAPGQALDVHQCLAQYPHSRLQLSLPCERVQRRVLDRCLDALPDSGLS